jgi:hypothetical protein
MWSVVHPLRFNKLFATVPNSPDAGVWANTPLAFTRANFTFYNAQRHLLGTDDLDHLSRLAEEVHIRFRYDKSLLNSTIQKFRRTHGNFICAVKASVAIFCRAAQLCIPVSYPIGAYRSNIDGDYKFLRGGDVSNIMRYACRLVYPDELHYMRRHIDRIIAHSNRVTACLALHQASVIPEDITFRLHWQVPSVQFYIRESYATLGKLTQKAVAGAALTT